MKTCSIIIKIKDYFPKIDSIPYQNFICLFTNGENEGQIPLISKENESYKHQVKNVLSDIKYKIHVLDYNDMSLIGMCEMVISYDIISQITPPNGFIQEQQKKLLMDTNTKRKLFGTVLNIGDIYLNIYSEIYLSETKSNNNINTKTNVTRKKNKQLEGSKKKFDGSPRTVHKKQIMMQINSDRRALININKSGNNNLFEKKQKYKNINSNGKTDKNMTSINHAIINTNNVKPNSSFNYRDIISSKENKINNSKNISNINNSNNVYKKINNNIKNKNSLKNNQKQNIIKNIIDRNAFSNNNDKDKENNIFNHNIYSRYKTESSKTGINSNLKKIDKKPKNKQNKQSLANSISPKLSKENFSEKDEMTFNNNTGNKITTIESLENIDFSGKKYITKTKPKKNNSQSNITAFGNNTLFSTTSTEQEFNDMDKIILQKGTEIRNDFNTQLKNNKKISLNNNINNTNLNSASNTNSSSNNKNSDYLDNDNIIKTQIEIKNNFIKLIEFYSLLSQKLIKIRDKNISSFNKNVIYKEKLFNEFKKNNSLTEKKTNLESENFLNINNHGCLNEKFLRPMIKMKKLEFKIFQNIFNLFYYEYDILKFKEFENNKKMDENVKIELLLMVFKNLVKNYGNVSQIYLSNTTKKTLIKNCFNKYGIEEKENGEWNIDHNINDIDNNKNIKEKNFDKKINPEKNENKNDIDKFKVIKEVDEEKEEEFDDEEKLNSNSERISNNQVSYSNSNTKDNMNFYSNDKLKSDNKTDKNISGQKKLFETNDENTTNKKENNLEEVKYNLSDKIIEHENDDIKNSNINDEINKNLNKDLDMEKEEKNSIENQQKNIIQEENNRDDKSILDNDIKNKDIIEEIIENGNEEKQNIINNTEKESIKNNEIDNKIEPEIINEEKRDLSIKNIEKENINEDKDININSEKEEKEEQIKAPTKREIYTRKNRHKYFIQEPEPEEIKEINNNINNNFNNNERAYYKKNKIKKDIYDEEDLIMQKILTEDFAKKCKEENRFVRISKYEYSFGDEIIKVTYKDGDVILKLDEGDYKLQEFIDILNEGKNEEEDYDNDEEINEYNNEENIEQEKEKENENEEENENNIEENNINENNEIYSSNKKEKEIDINNNDKIEIHTDDKKEIDNSDKKENNSEKSNKENNSSINESKNKKRRKKRVSEDSSFDKDINDNEPNSENEKIENEIKNEKKEKEEIEIKNEKKEIIIEKEMNNTYNSDIGDKNKIINTEGNESDINSENKGRKYVIKRRRDYKEKKF